MKAAAGGLDEYFKFGGEGAGELSAVGCASTGRDAGGGSVFGEEMLELRQGERGASRDNRGETR